MTIPTEVAEHIAALKKYADETFGAAMVGVIANRLESALTKAEAVEHAGFQIRCEGGQDWVQTDSSAYEVVKASRPNDARRVYAHARPPAVPVESRYECRECIDCGHAGINDASQTVGACFSCEWSGPEPVEDKCPGCGDEGCMTAACPKCGARYRFIAELEPAILPAEPVESPSNDALDAARFRWLRDHAINTEGAKGSPWCVYGLHLGDCTPTFGAELVAFVDDAMANGIVCSPVPVESMGRDAEPAGGLDAAMRTNGLPAVSDALGYSRNFAAANPHLTQTTKDHITGLCDMLELASAHQTTPPTPPPASVPDGCLPVHVITIRNIEHVGRQCLDGGKCHHECEKVCARRTGCVPLSLAGSYLNDDWTLKPTNQEGAAPSTLAGFGPMPSVDLSGLTILDGEEEENHHGQ